MMKATIKHCLLAVSLAMAATTASAQDLNASYFTQDFKYRHQLNPAFGNDQGYAAIPIMGNLNVKMMGNFGLSDVLFQDPATGKYNRLFLHEGVSASEALSGLNDENRLAADIGLTLASVGFKGLGGYNTVELRVRTSMGVNLPYELFEFAKDTKNQSYEFGNIGMRAQSFTELALGHSHQITEDLRVGAKVKVLLGIARADLNVEGLKADLQAGSDTWTISSGKAEAEINMKGITFKDKSDEYKSKPGTYYEHVDLGSAKVDGAGLGGFGLGLDLGAVYDFSNCSVEALKGFKVSAALVDLGFLSWSSTTLLKKKDTNFTFNGFQNIGIKDDEDGKLSKQVDKYTDELSDFISLENKGDQGSTSTSLAATANLGIEYTLPVYKPLSFGLLTQHRFNGDYSWTEGRLSANWAPLSWLDGGVSVAVNTFTTSAGWVLNVHPAGFNFFIGMDHILGKMSKEFIPLSSNASVAIGMNIAWGKAKKSKSKFRNLL